MCTFFAVSRAAYYAWLKRSQQPDKDSARLQAVQQAWEKSHRTYGYRRVALWLRQHKGLVINHKAVLRLMNKLNIRSIARQRHPYKQRARLDFHQRYANLSKCSAHTDPVSRPSSFVTGRSVLGFTVWPEISQQTNPIRNGLLIHLRRTQYRCHLHRYPTRLGVSGHHQGPVRRFHRCTSSGKTPRPVPIPMQCARHCAGLGNSVRLVIDTLKQARRKEKVTAGLLLHSDHLVQSITMQSARHRVKCALHFVTQYIHPVITMQSARDCTNALGRDTRRVAAVRGDWANVLDWGDINTLPSSMLPLPGRITSPLPCLGVAIVGIMRPWRTSLVI